MSLCHSPGYICRGYHTGEGHQSDAEVTPAASPTTAKYRDSTSETVLVALRARAEKLYADIASATTELDKVRAAIAEVEAL